MSGDEAICVNTADGIRQVPQFWVNGRPRRCRLPAQEEAEAPRGGPSDGQDIARRLSRCRRSPATGAAGHRRRVPGRHHVRLALGMLLAVAIIFWIALMVSRQFFAREVPPEEFLYDLPVRIGNEDALLGVKVIKWKVPAKLQQDWLDAIKQQIEAEAKKREEAEKQRQEEAAAKEKADKGGKAPKGGDVKGAEGESGGQKARKS